MSDKCAPTDDFAVRALRQMELIRATEERLLGLFSERKLSGTTHTCIGQEVCAVSVISALDLDRDIVFSNHRCHGHFLAYSDNLEGLIAEIMGRQSGVCSGRGGSQHLCFRNFYSNGVLGGTVPVATGVALGEKINGSGAITVCFLGDGALGEGVVYEALNMASLWEIPILYVLEYNQYAQSTPTAWTTAGEVAARATAFGIETDRRPADDPLALGQHLKEVVERVRKDQMPFFQILDTYRLAAHSKGDDNRDPEEIEAYLKRDPLLRLQEKLGEKETQIAVAEARTRVQLAVDTAEEAAFSELDPAAEEEDFADRVRCEEALAAFAGSCQDPFQLVVQQLNGALHTLMEEDHSVLFIGEDVLDPYGGAFKVSRGLSTKFPDRLLTTPISEAGIVGLGAGLSLRGLRPIVEIMFGDFLTLTADQIINHLAKFNWVYDGQVETPIVIRTPMGGGRGYGPTHSQSLEKIFLGIPGLVTVGLSLRHNPAELLRRAVLEDPRPVLFIEQKVLYAKRVQGEAPVGMRLELCESEKDSLYPTGTWRPVGLPADLTVVTFGAMTEVVEEALNVSFNEDEVVADYVVPSQLSPLRVEPIVESVQRSGRLLVVEEATTPWGFGAEVVARVAEVAGNIQATRVGAYQLPIPDARGAEESVLPTVGRIVEAIKKLVQ